MLEINTKAPSFSLMDQDGNLHTLNEYLNKGKKVLIYFYPKDNTPGCTMQACGYSSLISKFLDKDTIVIGISKDSVSSHKKFEKDHKLNFTLLSDPTSETLKSYDVFKQKSLYGRTFLGVIRTTYLLDETGIIIYANNKVKAKEDPLKMLEKISK